MKDPNDIGDDELLYRKVSVNSKRYDLEQGELKPLAVYPREEDTTGISFDRAQSKAHPEFHSIEEAAQGPSPNGYYVIVFRAGDLRSHGMSIVADPLEDNPGHALLQDLTYDNRKEPSSREKMVLLAHRLVVRVEGPFPSGSE